MSFIDRMRGLAKNYVLIATAPVRLEPAAPGADFLVLANQAFGRFFQIVDPTGDDRPSGIIAAQKILAPIPADWVTQYERATSAARTRLGTKILAAAKAQQALYEGLANFLGMVAKADGWAVQALAQETLGFDDDELTQNVRASMNAFLASGRGRPAGFNDRDQRHYNYYRDHNIDPKLPETGLAAFGIFAEQIPTAPLTYLVAMRNFINDFNEVAGGCMDALSDSYRIHQQDPRIQKIIPSIRLALIRRLLSEYERDENIAKSERFLRLSTSVTGLLRDDSLNTLASNDLPLHTERVIAALKTILQKLTS